MRIGLHLGYQNVHGMPDHEFFMKESSYAIKAEHMGFDFVGPVEHHFTDYAACPDSFQMLAWVAAQTKKIKLITGACILPWNNPLRVVEQAIELDILSGGRYILGMGRGAARREYRSFNADMADSREMFDEAVEIIIRGVETGIVEANGKFYKIPRTEIRPRPMKSFKDRTVMVTMSPSSVEVATKLGIQALRFSQGDWRTSVPEINKFRSDFIKLHNRPSPPFIISDFVLCFENQAKIEEYCDKYFSAMFRTVSNHYEIGGDHFKNLPSYGSYLSLGNAQEALGGPDKMYKAMIAGNMIGTPEQLIAHHDERVSLVGDYGILANFSWGGMPYDLVDQSMKLFTDKVMPHLKATKKAAAAAE